MAERLTMPHMIILLPGIMGSVLQKDGKDVWALSAQALSQFLKTRGTEINDLRIEADDWQHESLDDGITAVRLIEQVYSIPGLMEGAGYNDIRRDIITHYDVIEGDIRNPRRDANFFTFPYDWRRDNRAIALRLEKFIDRQLPIWQRFGGDKAKVILLGHSMGGLLARYYLEELGGWEKCLALITFGSPHRGSVNALDVLSNGFRVSGGPIKRTLMRAANFAFTDLFDNLTKLVRSFPSVYQLLPRYPMLLVEGEWKRIGETNGIPNIDRKKAAAAREDFHIVIDMAVRRNQDVAGYDYKTLPIIGTRQQTYQSATLRDGMVIPVYEPPPGLDPLRAHGDGTVPSVSALPIEMEKFSLMQRYFITEHHGMLPNNPVVLADMFDQITSLIAAPAPNLRGSSDDVRPMLSLELDPLYLAEDDIVMQLSAVPGKPARGLASGGSGSQKLSVTVERVDQPAPHILRHVTIPSSEEIVEIRLQGLAPGLYKMHTQSLTSGQKPMSIGGIFEVISANDRV